MSNIGNHSTHYQASPNDRACGTAERMERRLRVSGILIILGLIIEAFSLIWVHALSFIVFALIGGALIALGILTYLYSLVSAPQSPLAKTSID